MIEAWRLLVSEQMTVQKSLEVAFQTRWELKPLVCIWFPGFKIPMLEGIPDQPVFTRWV